MLLLLLPLLLLFLLLLMRLLFLLLLLLVFLLVLLILLRRALLRLVPKPRLPLHLVLHKHLICGSPCSPPVHRLIPMLLAVVVLFFIPIGRLV